MADIDPEFMDERVAELDDKLSELLAEMEATAIEWATSILHSIDTGQKTEES